MLHSLSLFLRASDLSMLWVSLTKHYTLEAETVFEMGKLLANRSIRDPNNKFFLSFNEREIVKAQINTSVSPTLQGESLFKTNGFVTPESVSWLCEGCIKQKFFYPLCVAILGVSATGAR